MKKHFWVSLVFILLFSCVSTDQDQDLAVEYYNVGNAFYEIDQFEKAEEYYLKALAVNPEFQKARFNLIYALISVKDFESAGEHVDYILESDSGNSKVMELEAYIAYKSGSLKESFAIYSKLYDNGYISTRILTNIVKVSYQLNEFKQAERYLEDLLLEKEDKDYYHLAGLIYEALEDDIKASEYYSLYLDLGGDDIEIVQNLLTLYRNVDDYDNLKKIHNYILDKGVEELVSSSQFELGAIALLYDNDFSLGFKYLKSSIDSGFKDVDKINSLIEEPDLIDRSKIRQLFIDNKIIR